MEACMKRFKITTHTYLLKMAQNFKKVFTRCGIMLVKRVYIWREDRRNKWREYGSSTHYCNNKNELIHINQCPYCPCRDKYTYIENKKQIANECISLKKLYHNCKRPCACGSKIPEAWRISCMSLIRRKTPSKTHEQNKKT